MTKLIQADFNGQAMQFTADGWFNATTAAEKYEACWAVLVRWLWRKSVWGKGGLDLFRIYATAPLF
ncbi:hypothetical protein [Chromobacterium paludis]|uniref:Uncharacterized protein n=1 Tax=Chromobacterium paludis TaxID=2605945 RepID=A0A5C1DHN0_9NEIS|nr:hypothetical protein [Chromobacterium paludis]QEL55138.1 hypothetical protein FYK34_05935 [Chromobacterium paludis]